MLGIDNDLMEPEQAQPEDELGKKLGRFLLDVLETIVMALLLYLGINAVSARIRVEGVSMEPSLHDGEFVIVSRLSYRFGDPQRGDIVVFPYPENPAEDYVKRIIGLPGDEILISNGEVIINGVLLDEPYINAPPNRGGSWTVPEGMVFVMGDNRNNSSDSREWGMLPIEDVIGKAVFVYWPPPDWGLLNDTVLAAP